MTHHLTADLIADELATNSPNLSFDQRGEGRVLVTLWRWDEDKGYEVEVEARTFRLVEVAE